MKCEYCDNPIPNGVTRCPSCGATVRVIEPLPGIVQEQPSPQSYTAQQHPQGAETKSRVIYVILGIFLGVLGIHNFYAGRTYRGLGQLLTTIFVGWMMLPLFAVWVWSIVDICAITTDGEGVKFR